MSNFDSHTLEVLEYPKIISILEGLCLTSYGLVKIGAIAPMNHKEAIETRLDETSQMKDIIRFGQAFPLSRVEDVTSLLNKSKAEGIFLEPVEFLRIEELIEISISLHNYAKSERSKFPLITGYLTAIYSAPEIKKAIDKTIDRDGTIKDSASPELQKIRSNIITLKSKIVSRLEHALTERHKSQGWQDDTVTIRDGRYVIPVIAGQFRSDSGIIHDRSQSGATFYVEPNEIVEANNNLGLLFQDERLEIDRILRRITSMIRDRSDQLLQNCDIIGSLDALHAAALFSIRVGGEKPSIDTENHLRLLKASHPLLLYYAENKDNIIANDISLDNGRLALIITGPNTGGKTVLLKAVGLLVLMAQSGLHIPADAKSEIGLFNNVMADIGDEQSIELSLSTFSSHLRQIIYAIQQAGPKTLILLDEIGAGTDPKEGAALAEAILFKLINLKAKAIVTTHYSQLKTLPMLYPEIENASFEFDKTSLNPTFRLLTGIPGASYAIEIAQRLGMPSSITDNALQLLGKGERSLIGLIESLEKELAILREDKSALEEKLKNAAQLEDYYHRQIDGLKQEIETAKKSHLTELEEILNEARSEVERLVKSIRESKASQESVKLTHRFLKEKRGQLESLKSKHIPQTVRTDKLAAGNMVMVESLRKEGELVRLIGDSKAKVRI
ncbi:MAG: hypothetical protein NTV06_00010, partial [candidate division Zixibacteria bacterium]|nr:hypothetical protein [candidate division Zixibacteria bacterium]